jgi:gliding motility-associated-like protein
VSQLYRGVFFLLFLPAFLGFRAFSNPVPVSGILPKSNFHIPNSRFSSRDSIADSCIGSSGDPIVKITFGSGPNYGAPLGSGITNLTYTPMGCPADGYYTLANMSTDCFGGDWQVSRDHTGDPQGYFMLINASYTPNDFYVQKVDGLCSGTRFEFSSWVMNMNNLSHGALILPNITFTIEDLQGNVLQKYTTGDIPQTYNPLWVKYGFNFITPQGVNSVILRLTNNAPGGNGNDLGIDDISFRPVGPQISSSVQNFPSDSITLCLGRPETPKSININATIQKCFTSPQFQWQESLDLGQTWTDIPGAINQNYTFPVVDTGRFYFRLSASQAGNISNPNCRFVSQNIKIGIYNVANPRLNIQASSSSVCQGSPIEFSATSLQSGTSPDYQWYLNQVKVGDNSPKYTSNSLSGTDSVYCIMTSSLPCSSPVQSNTLGFQVFPYPTIQLNSQFFIKNGISIYLNPVYTGNIGTYSWTPASGLSDPASPNPLVSPVNTTQYTLVVNSVNGCPDTVRTTVIVIYDLDIPNIFSPNNDGINDTWVIGHLTDFKNNTVDIFNRYGQMVFHSLGYANPWDGKFNGESLPIGTYYYIINPHFGNKIFSGSVTLIR